MMLDILRQMDLNITSYKRRLCININSFESSLNIELARFLWLSLTCRRAQKKSLENKRKKSNFFIRIINLKNDFLLAAPFLKKHLRVLFALSGVISIKSDNSVSENSTPAKICHSLRSRLLIRLA